MKKLTAPNPTQALAQEIADVKRHFMETLGNIPDPIRAMADYAPQALLGYTRTRNWIMARPPEAALDVRTKELIYVLLDVVTGNLDGAQNHLRAAMREGLTAAQATEGCMQVMAVCGITTWGQTGWKLCDFAFELEREARSGKSAKSGRSAKAGNARPAKTAKRVKSAAAGTVKLRARAAGQASKG